MLEKIFVQTFYPPMKMAVYSVLQLSVMQTLRWLRRKRSVRAGIPAQSQQRKGCQLLSKHSGYKITLVRRLSMAGSWKVWSKLEVKGRVRTAEGHKTGSEARLEERSEGVSDDDGVS
jgi:hypothetical protein